MNETINLLDPNKNAHSAVFLRRVNKMRVVTIVLLFVVSVSSVILFILVALSPLPTLQRQEQFLRQTLTASKSDIVKLSLVNSQADSIDTLLTHRKSFYKSVSLIQDKLSSDIKVDQIQIDDKSFQITVESSSLQSLDTFMNGLVGYVQSKNTFSKLTLVELVTNSANNAYSISILLNYL